MQKLHVGFDLDGVNISFQKGVDMWLKQNDYDLKCDPLSYNFWIEWGWSDDRFAQFWQEGVEAGVIFNNAPYRNSVEAVNKVYDAGHWVHIITHRGWPEKPGLAEDLTEAWLKDRGYKYHTLTFSGDKTIIKTDYFIEDNIYNYHALQEVGTEVYLLTRPWNDGLEGYRRVRSVTEFTKKIPGIE